MVRKIAFAPEAIAKLLDSFSESHQGKAFRFLFEKHVFKLKEDEQPCPGGLGIEFHAMLAERAEKRFYLAMNLMTNHGSQAPFSRLAVLDIYLSCLLAHSLLAEAMFIDLIGDD
jgi:hypothetical protein